MAVLVSVGDARFVHCAALSFTVIGKRPGGWNKGRKGGKGGKGKRQKGMDSTAFAGNDGCMGGFPGAVCSLRCALVHRYRETAKGIKQRRESKKRRDGKETAVVVIKLSQAPQ